MQIPKKHFTNQRIGDILVKQGLITLQQLEDCLRIQKNGNNKKLGKILVENGYLSSDELHEVLEFIYETKYIELSNYIIDPEVIKIITEKIASQYHLIPISKNNGELTIAMSNPLDVHAIDFIKNYTKTKKVNTLMASEEDISTAISNYYELGEYEDILEKFGTDVVLKEEGEEEEDLQKLETLGKKAPIIQLVNMIIVQGVKDRASDIHIEPNEMGLLIRFRIDGMLQDIRDLPNSIKSAIISRIKILSKMDIAERRLPQDGRFQIKFGSREVDLRVSSIPTVFGEKIVLRLLDKSKGLINLKQVGFLPKQLAVFKSIINKPHGIVLLTGPTGSGKSTTLYAVLNEINSKDKNIVTVEDPVEYKLNRISQIQIKPKINLTFANTLRSILRQDPDIIMVGEIRDAETAQIAVQAALTGHLVFSTLHTNDAAGALTRLIDMGVEPFLISSSIIGVLAQRLVRVVCEKCKEEYTPSEEVIRFINEERNENNNNLKLYRGKGCPYCRNTGYYGRTSIYELITIDEEIRSLILSKTSSSVIKEAALKKGMKTLLDSGIEKALSGITTMDEVMRVAG
ncbi:MAG: type II secretion system ATPase GspE, partial [Candidatus Caldatribacteriota bacterium]|nr:type II secretion system ATPase GspE [Candidatus Caldatribacteriota bacterium]